MILTGLLPSWELALDGANRSPKTIKAYFDSVRRLDAYLAKDGLPLDAPSIRAFLVAERDRTSPESSAKHYRHLHAFFRWCETEGDILDANPMTKVAKPNVAEKVKPFFNEDDLLALLRVTRGQDFESRRDHAIIRIFIDSGVRVSGLAGLRFDPADENKTDVFLPQRRLRIRLKGGDAWWIPIGARTGAAIDRYLRSRARHQRAESQWLWLGMVGHNIDHFGDSGIRQMIARRGEQAGIQHAHPHKFRTTFADGWLASGGTIDDLQAVGGWRSLAMPLKYAKGRQVARAAEAHRRLSPGDRL
jgi:site-specific recombinase XerD